GATFTEAMGINPQGEISGVYSFVARVEGATDNHGFVLSKGKFTSFDPPGATATFGWKINARGQIAGCWTDANGTVHGVLRIHGSFTTIDFPGSTHGYSSDINDPG